MDLRKQFTPSLPAVALGAAISAITLWLFATRLGTQPPAGDFSPAWLLAPAAVGGLILALIYTRQRRLGATWLDLALATVFLLALILPLLGALSSGAAETSEKRALNQKPPLPNSWKSLRDFPEIWTAYFNDHFGWRREMIYLNSLLKVAALRTSPSGNVVIGRDGWLFFAGEESMWDYQGLVPLDAANRERIYRYLRAANKSLRENNIAFLVAIAPNKQSVYPEYLPASIRKIKSQTRLDQLLEYNVDNARLPILDLRPALQNAKQQQPQYHKTDTHWNAAGAFTAYREIIGALIPRFPLLRPYEIEDYTVRTSRTRGADLAALINLESYYSDTYLSLSPRLPRPFRELPLEYSPENVISAELTVIDEPDLPTAVIFHDSYGPFLKPFLSQHFRRTVYIRPHVLIARKGSTPDRPRTDVEPPKIDWDIVEREKPDVVILIFAERFLIHVGY